MPVIRRQTAEEQATWQTARPSWLKASAYGSFRLAKGTPTSIELHYHDADEIWFIGAGRARIRSEGVEYDVRPGDLVCTGMGDEHQILEVYEELIGFFLEGELEGLRRPGHLHRETDGVPVPRRRPATIEPGR